MEIIGLSGHSGTGKDFLTKNYFKSLGYYNFSLAWHLKIDTIGKKEATREEVFITKPPNVRSWLQRKGTEEWRVNFGANVWLDLMNEWITLLSTEWEISKFICPDVRFLNEVDYIHNIGGKIFRIIAPKREKNNKLTSEQRNHSSEIELDNYDKFDGIIYNDPQYSETIEKQILTLLGQDTTVDMPVWEELWDKFENMFENVIKKSSTKKKNDV